MWMLIVLNFMHWIKEQIMPNRRVSKRHGLALGHP